MSPASKSAIREDALRDVRYPAPKIVEQLLPYLQVLVEQFHPKQVILFRSYAYGVPTHDRDVDLLIVRDSAPYPHSLAAAKAIRHAWWPVHRTRERYLKGWLVSRGWVLVKTPIPPLRLEVINRISGLLPIDVTASAWRKRLMGFGFLLSIRQACC